MVEGGLRAVVTGAGGAIGAAVCRRLLGDGHRVLGVDVDESSLEVLAKELDVGDRFASRRADVTVEPDVEAYVGDAVERFGGIDAFFNNAGIEGKVAPLTELPVEAFDQVMAVNVRGVFLGLKHVLRVMGTAGGGSIVNTSSVAGLVAVGGVGPYVASKHAVAGLTKVAALEGAAVGVRVNAVCPGPQEGRMMTSLQDQAAPMLGAPDGEAVRAAFTGMVPGGRYGRPDEVADLVAYLLGPTCSYVSGAIIPIDWGWTAQ